MNTMTRVFLLLLLALPATAQSFNVDVANAGTAAGTPAPVYGAAAAQPGVWNMVSGASLGPFPLVDLAGAPTGVTCVRDDALGNYFSYNNSLTTGYFQWLMDDAHNTGVIASGAVNYTLNGLAAGRYVVHTYAWSPLSAAQSSAVTVAGSTSPNPQYVGGALPALNTFALGTTHAVHVVVIATGQPLVITCATAAVAGTLNGFQISSSYQVALTQSGTGALTTRCTGGAPGGVYATLATFFQGSYPNGPLFGLDLAVADAVLLLSFGPPFLGMLDGDGLATTVLPPPMPTGLTIYAVGVELDPAGSTIVAVTAPFAYTFL